MIFHALLRALSALERKAESWDHQLTLSSRCCLRSPAQAHPNLVVFMSVEQCWDKQQPRVTHRVLSPAPTTSWSLVANYWGMLPGKGKKDLSCWIADLCPDPGRYELSAVTSREDSRLAPGDLCALGGQSSLGIQARTLGDPQQSYLGA